MEVFKDDAWYEKSEGNAIANQKWVHNHIFNVFGGLGSPARGSP